MNTSPLVALVSGMLLIGTAQAQDDVVLNATTLGPDLRDTETSNTAEFRVKALQADVASIAVSKLALERSRDPDIRDYAERVIATGRATSAALLPKETNVDSSSNLPWEISVRSEDDTSKAVRVTLGPANRARVDRLKSAPNTDAFDRDFVAQQARSDARTLSLYTSYARNGDSELGRRFANEALPWIAAQLDRSNSLQARYGS